MTTTRQNLRIAALVSMLFHPFLLPLPTLALLLIGDHFFENVFWIIFLLVITILPGTILAVILTKRGYLLSRRTIRTPFYWLGALWLGAFYIILSFLNAPTMMRALIGALVVWLPLQGVLNIYVSKVSIHAAVSTGCFTALLLVGKLDNALLFGVFLSVVLLSGWSRITLKEHAPTEVILGWIVGSLPVILVFSLLRP